MYNLFFLVYARKTNYELAWFHITFASIRIIYSSKNVLRDYLT